VLALFSTAAFGTRRQFVMSVVTDECTPPFIRGHGDFRRTVRRENVLTTGLLLLSQSD